MMEYQRFDPSTLGFPKPNVPMLPTLGRHSLRLGRPAGSGALTKAPNARFYARGRYALTDAYRLCGVGANTALLAPSYHCRTMLDPAIRLQAEIGLYPLAPDLRPQLDRLTACLAACSQPVKALLVTHYFGFQQKLDSLLKFCDKHGIALIEDCSHCLFVPSDANDLGRLGRYNVSSPYKFFPSGDGGVLWANHDAAMPLHQPEHPDLTREFKGLARALQHSWTFRRSPDIDALAKEVAALSGAPVAVGPDLVQTSHAPSDQYEAALENLESLAGSRWIIRHANIARLAKRRRQHYLQWAQAVAHLPHCHALFPLLPDADVPYMFPLRITHPEVHFFMLKRLGVPVWRWDDMAVSSCGVASDYRLQLLHLPCHQELTADQMAWMTCAVAKVFNSTPMERLK